MHQAHEDVNCDSCGEPEAACTCDDGFHDPRCELCGFVVEGESWYNDNFRIRHRYACPKDEAK